MTDFVQAVAALREQMHATLSRSDILKALVWSVGLLMTATVAAVAAKSPLWILVIFSILLSFSVVLYFLSFVYCLMKMPDALRSETYSLNKMALEHGVYGDNRVGVIEQAPAAPRLLEDINSQSADEEQ
jgi:hypothetical protein